MHIEGKKMQILPVCDVASKLYSWDGNRHLVISVNYSSMNLGNGVGNLVLAALIYKFVSLAHIVAPSEMVVFVDPPNGEHAVVFHSHGVTPQRLMLFLFAAIAAIAGLVAALSVGNVRVDEKSGRIVRDATADVNDKEYVAAAQQQAASAPTPAPVALETILDKRRELTVIRRVPTDRWDWRASLMRVRLWLRNDLTAMPRDPTFRRLFLFVLISLGARQVFQQFNTALPLYIDRVLGHDAPLYLFLSINPIGVAVGAPLVALVTPRFDMYVTIICGASIASASLLLLVLFEPSSAVIAATLSIFTVGEIIYSPLLTQYILALSPPQKEGQYSAFSSLPMFLGKIVVAVYSGALLDTVCPEDSAGENCGTLWLRICLLSWLTPFFYCVFYCYIHTPEVRQRLSNHAVFKETLEAASVAASSTDDDNDDDSRVDFGTPPAEAPISDQLSHRATASLAAESTPPTTMVKN